MVKHAPVTPAVHIFRTPCADAVVVDEILLGIEEEGIPAQVREEQLSLTADLAKAAADSSLLNVGIAVSSILVIVHHRDLPPDKPLFLLRAKNHTSANLKLLGVNAARLVKGNPLVLNGDFFHFGTYS